MIIDIVTPTYNRDRFLAETLESVITQKTDGKINYYIMDGGSTDNTIEISQIWKAKAQVANSNLTMDIEIGKDKGMYDAIFKGFNKGSGDIMAWINSDDIYLPKALSVVENIFESFPEVDWLCGIPSIINIHGSITKVRTSFPYKSQDGIRRGIYSFKHAMRFCPPIQQDCVFWRRSLWNKLTPDFFEQFKAAKYAGDHFLWSALAKHAKLYHLECSLSCFRVHGNQLTTSLSGYAQEMGGQIPKWRDTLISAVLNAPYVAPSIFFKAPWKNYHSKLCSKVGSGFIFWDDDTAAWIKRT